MGQDVSPRSRPPHDRGQYRHKMQRCLDTFARMLAEERFTFPRKHIGLEVELNLVDSAMRPSMSNAAVLAAIDDELFTTELSQHNIELNVPPRPLDGESALQLENDLHAHIGRADATARESGAHVAAIGILPTIGDEHFDQKWLTNNPRYALLNDRILASRGECPLLSLEGRTLNGQYSALSASSARTAQSVPSEDLHTYTESILPEAACTSVQLHLQVAPDDFAAHWNAAQCLAGPQVALGANSPFLLGKALWAETRIPLFLQATDTRPEELKNQGVRPRVWFGERWITSIFDLFEENVRYFPGLLPETDDEDPMDALDDGRAPKLTELRLHNGTVWRWNRPVYDVVDGTPHLRVENRVLPAGPTALDMMANAALFYGAQRALAEEERPVWTRMSFHAAEQNLHAGARHGFDAQFYWPGIGTVPPDELALRVLLPLAHEGLRSSGVSSAVADRYLGVVERRCVTKRNGSTWQRDAVAAAQQRGLDRDSALAAMLGHYLDLAREGEPVHDWPVP